MNEFADSLGMELKDVPGELGKEFGKNVLSKFKDTDFGKRCHDQIPRVER